MARKTLVPDESLQPVHQTDQDAQFFKVPVTTPQAQDEAPQGHYAYSEKTIFGLRAATFWLSLTLCLVIIDGVVGGAVGGASVHSHCGSRW
jgi:hypothetical protein